MSALVPWAAGLPSGRSLGRSLRDIVVEKISHRSQIFFQAYVMDPQAVSLVQEEGP